MVAALLLEGGVRLEDNWPLTLACFEGHVEVVRVILEEGNPDLNATDSRGYTPLSSAVRFHKREIVELLLAAGADPSAPDGDSKTPIELAELEWDSQIESMVKKAAVNRGQLQKKEHPYLDCPTCREYSRTTKLHDRRLPEHDSWLLESPGYRCTFCGTRYQLGPVESHYVPTGDFVDVQMLTRLDKLGTG
jgi:hypothetical protein